MGRRSTLRRPLRMPQHVTLSTASFDVDKFCENFVSKVQGVAAATDPAQSSRELRKLVKSKALKFTDMQVRERVLAWLTIQHIINMAHVLT